jgi:predicted nucleotidyltransferase
MEDTEIINAMSEQIAREFSPLQIILFGSRARGQAGAFSDVDFLVVLPSVANKRHKAIEIRRTLSGYPIAKDIIVTTPDEIARRGELVGSVLRSALKEGRVIYERP